MCPHATKTEFTPHSICILRRVSPRMNTEPITQSPARQGNVARNSIASILLANQKKKLQNEVESLIAGIAEPEQEARGKKARKSSVPTTAPAPKTSASPPKSQNSGKPAKPLEQTLLQSALEKRRIRPIPAAPPAAAQAKIELADEKVARQAKTVAAASKKPKLPGEKRWWVQKGRKAVLLNAEQMAAAYSQGLLRISSVRVREENGTEWHPITRFLHEFSWEAELGHPDAPPTAAQLQAWKRLGQR